MYYLFNTIREFILVHFLVFLNVINNYTIYHSLVPNITINYSPSSNEGVPSNIVQNYLKIFPDTFECSYFTTYIGSLQKGMNNHGCLIMSSH